MKDTAANPHAVPPLPPDQHQRRAEPDGWSFRRAASISIYAIALSALWTPLNALILPDKVSDLTPDALRGSALGAITLVGIGIAALTQPIAGRASDRAPLRDRRKPFITLSTAACLPLIALFWWSPDFLVLLAVYVALQLSTNIGQAAFQALIPDLVEPERHGFVSGVKSAFDVFGAILGLTGVGLLLIFHAGEGLALLFLAVVLALGAALNHRWTPAVPPEGAPSRWRDLFRLTALRDTAVALVRAPAAFQSAVLMRFLFMLSVYPVQRFLVFYLEDEFNVQDPAREAAFYVLGGILIGAAGATLGGLLSDLLGRRLLLRVSVALAAIGLAGMALSVSLLTLAISGSLVAFGAGAFQAVNWAALSDSTPTGEGALYFGLASIASSGASALTGLLGPPLDVANELAPAVAYRATFAITALLALLTLLPLRVPASTDPAEP